jgi:hypothetical protein
METRLPGGSIIGHRTLREVLALVSTDDHASGAGEPRDGREPERDHDPEPW